MPNLAAVDLDVPIIEEDCNEEVEGILENATADDTTVEEEDEDEEDTESMKSAPASPTSELVVDSIDVSFNNREVTVSGGGD